MKIIITYCAEVEENTKNEDNCGSHIDATDL